MNYFYYKVNITPNCYHRNFASSWLDKKWSQIHKLFTSCWSAAIHNLISLSKEKYNRLSRDVVTSKMDHDISTAYCWSSSGDEVHWAHVTYRLHGIPCLWLAHLRKVPLAVEFHSITADWAQLFMGDACYSPRCQTLHFFLSLNCIQLIDVHRSVKFWKNVYIRFRATLTYQKLRWLWPVYADFQRDTSWYATPEHANKIGHHPLWNEVKFIDRDSHW